VKALHLSDVHFCREHAAEALASLEVARQTAERERVDVIALAGDLFDRGLQASDRDAMPELIAAIRGLLAMAPIVAVQGTPTHDVPGCYEVLTHLEAPHNLTLLYPDSAYAIAQQSGLVAPLDEVGIPTLLILGCPEPGKEWLLAQRDGLGAAEASQAAVDAMRALLLGLGSMRREHPDIPALFLYHGNVRGATMGAGQTVGAQEIVIGREDLQLVGADYYALGHIHQAQQIAELPAYYAGSAYPVNWGERDPKGCWIATLETPNDDGARWITCLPKRVPFPHPPRVKLEWDGVSFDAFLDDRPMDGRQTWLMVRNSAENLATLDEEDLLGWLVGHGALPGSRVTFEPIPVETVRAREITEAQHLPQKVIIWAEASSLPEPTESALDKAVALEEEARQSGAVGAGAHICLQRLRLRGAIGVWKGLGVDEVTFDLEATERGLVALVGPNGAGKSTLIENLHPYSELLTRGGSLQSHFRLKDSARELFFRDEASGTDYRALILIDPTLSTPKTEYHLYRRDATVFDGGDPWTPLTNGRKEDYLRAIEELWGSLDMFLRSAFVAQKPAHGHPDLADATPAERKALFRELLGLDYLQAYAEVAKGRADALDGEIRETQARADQIAEDLARRPEIETELAAKRAEYEAACTKQEQIERRGKFQKALVGDLELQVAEQREMIEHRRGLTEEGSRLTLEVAGIERRRGEAEKAIAGRTGAEAVVQQAADLERAKGVLNEKRAEVATGRERIMADHARALAAHRHARDAVQAEIRRLEKSAAEIGAKKIAAVTQIDTLVVAVSQPVNDTCPTCGQTLPADKRAELIEIRNRCQTALAERQEQVLGYDNLLADNEREQKAQERKLTPEPRAPELPVFAEQAALDKVLAELEAFDLTAARETIRLADAAQAEIAAGVRRAEEIAVRQIEIERDRTDLLARIDETIAAKHAGAKAEHERLQRAYVEARETAAALNAQAESFTSLLSEMNKKAEAFTSLNDGLVKSRADLADWRYLERACGRDGIQALELDAAGPSIADTANQLLDAAYGSRFRVEIRTTRIAGKGSRVKQVEDFEIIVRDTEHGTEQALDTLSGGETVWVRKALYAAFGIIRARSTGTRFLTVCLDEADGALDPDARRRYVAMLQAEHAAAGRAHTIVITHSEAAQEMIPSRVEMRELAREAVPV
jgi:exonuclease SbcC